MNLFEASLKLTFRFQYIAAIPTERSSRVLNIVLRLQDVAFPKLVPETGHPN
jgi:hypothetical protein